MNRRNPAFEGQLGEIARKVSGRKGWEFRALHPKPVLDETPPIAKPTPERLRTTFAEIEALTQDGHSAAAFVTAWTALEALARLAGVDGEAERPAGLSPMQAVQASAEQGSLENEDAGRPRGMAGPRNAVVHGDFSVDLAVEQVEEPLGSRRALASAIAEGRAEQAVFRPIDLPRHPGTLASKGLAR